MRICRNEKELVESRLLMLFNLNYYEYDWYYKTLVITEAALLT
ncbi:hypothetical protein [Acinetobacter dispersus]|nr:hypothetical protein [Acinetobacter dispersus]